jgi:sulfur-oxidizing protein SoxZ
VIDVTLEPAISTNPYFQFDAVVNETGTFQFTWYDDDGSVYEDSAEIKLTAERQATQPSQGRKTRP